MDNRSYSASLSQSQGRSGYSVIFRHPVRTDEATGKPGVRVRRGLGTRDKAEADQLRDELNALLGDPSYHNAAARAEAEAANRAKDNFLAMLGHELRNPLAPALSAVQLSKIRGDRPTVYERDVIERQIRHLARLVDDLLDVARLRRGELSLNRARFDMIDAVNRAVEMTSPLVAERQHKLTVEVPRGLFLDGDELRLTQVIVNLLTNAVKYTERGGRLALRARADNRVLVFECEDNGAGISAALLPRLFLPFVQGDQGIDRQKGGLGLGLAVAKAVVEAHGGSLEARSAGLGQGSTLVLRLPLAVVGDAVAPATPGSGAAGARPYAGRVLVVDDNQDSVGTLVALLAASGGQVVDVGVQEVADGSLGPGAGPIDLGHELGQHRVRLALATPEDSGDVPLLAADGIPAGVRPQLPVVRLPLEPQAPLRHGPILLVPSGKDGTGMGLADCPRSRERQIASLPGFMLRPGRN